MKQIPLNKKIKVIYLPSKEKFKDVKIDVIKNVVLYQRKKNHENK